MSYILSIIIALGLILQSSQSAASPYSYDRKEPISLPRLNIDPKGVTISGVSAGGFMAVQMHVAHSKVISGVATVASGLYWCGEGAPMTAYINCMFAPALLNVNRYVRKARAEASVGHIDALENLADDRVYIFSGSRDFVIDPRSSDKLAEFYSAFMNPENIRRRDDFPASHGFPTVDFGSNCRNGGMRWLLNCNFDTAGELLSHLYGSLSPWEEANLENLINFSQDEFDTDGRAWMYSEGKVYIPNACKSGAIRCKMHIALHGCQMNPQFAGQDFPIMSGYNRWAEANNIVVLYPAAAISPSNPLACWDWYGFTGTNYVEKGGPQIHAIRGMIDRLMGKDRGTSTSTSVETSIETY